MSEKTNIQWTDSTWNIARGCTKVDEDCKNCYMYRDSMNGTRYKPREVVRTKTVFNLPLKLKKDAKSNCWDGPPLIFTSSLTDVFHEHIDSYRMEMWDIIRQCPHLIFQILTKRPERIMDHLPPYWDEIKNNVWMGTSVGSQAAAHRMDILATMEIDCIKFLSLEPLHGPITLPLDMSDGSRFFDWIIIGGESGHDTGTYRFRECKLEWINDIIVQCNNSGYHKPAIFVKQLGTYLAKKRGMSDRHGGNIDEFPWWMQCREFPNHLNFNTLQKSPISYQRKNNESK